MPCFMLSRSTRIEADETLLPVHHAAEILRRDMAECLRGTGPENVIRVLMDASLAPETYEGRCTEHEIELRCGDDLGAVYALLSVSEKFLGIKPLGWWMEQKSPGHDRVQIPGTVWKSPEYAVRYRSWFVNDEILFVGWHQEETQREKVWKRVFETILRCGGNMVIAGTDRSFDGEKLNETALEMGLWLTQHHTELLGAKMFSRVYPGRVPSYDLYPELFEKLWQESIDRYAGKRVVWAVGFRGQGDNAFWLNDGKYDTDEKRGELISKVIRRQMELVRRKDPEAVFSTNLYGEMMALYRGGYLQLPDEVIRIWGDNGFGKMVSRRQGNSNPRTPSMPDGDGKGGNGIYYHVSFYDLQAANHITMLQIPPEEIAGELAEIVRRKATALWNINVGSVRPHMFMLDLVRKMWTDGSCDVRELAREFARDYFGTEEAAALLLSYGQAAAFYGEHTDDRAGDQFDHFPLRAIAHSLLNGRVDAGIPSLRWITDGPFPDQVRKIAEIEKSGMLSWSEYVKNCRHEMEKMPEHEAHVLEETLLLPGLIHEMGARGLYAFCQACAHAVRENWLQAYLWTDRALESERAALRAMRVSGRFAHLYDNDCFAGVGLSAQVLEGVRLFPDPRGRGNALRLGKTVPHDRGGKKGRASDPPDHAALGR